MNIIEKALRDAILVEIWEPGTILEIYESQKHINLFAKQVYDLILEPRGW